MCNFADDTTPYVCDENFQVVLEKLEHHSDIAISWFERNYMKLNTDKCHLLVSGHRYEHMWIRVGLDKIWEDKEAKLLGITIDNDLKFDQHVSDICLKANRKLSALIRMSKFLTLDKRRIVFKAFVESQFQYCSLVWVFHSRTLNNRINRLHERALRTVYDDYELSFQTLLNKDCSYIIHHKNIQRLAIEIYKMINDQICAPGFKDLFCLRDVCNSRSFSDIIVPSVKSVFNGQNSLRYLGPLIWNSISIEIRRTDFFEAFKSKIKKWKPEKCPCRLCKTYVAGVGFINVT